MSDAGGAVFVILIKTGCEMMMGMMKETNMSEIALISIIMIKLCSGGFMFAV